jgi:hypothetical protein
VTHPGAEDALANGGAERDLGYRVHGRSGSPDAARHPLHNSHPQRSHPRACSGCVACVPVPGGGGLTF